jgi:hypothetical protein
MGLLWAIKLSELQKRTVSGVLISPFKSISTIACKFQNAYPKKDWSRRRNFWPLKNVLEMRDVDCPFVKMSRVRVTNATFHHKGSAGEQCWGRQVAGHPGAAIASLSRKKRYFGCLSVPWFLPHLWWCSARIWVASKNLWGEAPRVKNRDRHAIAWPFCKVGQYQGCFRGGFFVTFLLKKGGQFWPSKLEATSVWGSGYSS